MNNQSPHVSEGADLVPMALHPLQSFALRVASSVLPRVNLLVSRDDVVWCYKYLLGRDPESEASVASKQRFRDFRALAQHFVDSDEYLSRHAVSREDVLWCYKNLLGREPESEKAIHSYLRSRDFRSLVQFFVHSDEYSNSRAVTREDVLWCYEHLLCREPESEDAILSHLRSPDFRSLVHSFVKSDEYVGDPMPINAMSLDTGSPQASPDAIRAALAESAKKQAFSESELSYIATHSDRLLHAMSLLVDLLPLGGRLLDFSARAYFVDAISVLRPDADHVVISEVNYELDEYFSIYGENAFDFCLNMEVLEHLSFDPAHMVWSINRMLKPGGLLFLSTPNALAMANALHWMQGDSPTLWNQVIPGQPYFERHNRDWTPSEVVRILEEHGFGVLEVCAFDFYETTRELLRQHSTLASYLRRHASHAYFGDTLCVLARKLESVAAPIRNPWLYSLRD